MGTLAKSREELRPSSDHPCGGRARGSAARQAARPLGASGRSQAERGLLQDVGRETPAAVHAAPGRGVICCRCHYPRWPIGRPLWAGHWAGGQARRDPHLSWEPRGREAGGGNGLAGDSGAGCTQLPCTSVPHLENGGEPCCALLLAMLRAMQAFPSPAGPSSFSPWFGGRPSLELGTRGRNPVHRMPDPRQAPYCWNSMQ